MRRAACLAVVVGVCGTLVATGAAIPRAPAYTPTHLSIPSELPDATAAKAYGYSFAGDVSGGTGPPYDWVVKGQVPPGLALGGASGRLGGTPTRPGTYSFSVCATGRRRPVGGSAPGNTACDSTKVTVDKPEEKRPPAPAACTSFTLAAVPPGVNVDIDGARATTVVQVSWTPASCTKAVGFSTIGSPPTGLSISFLGAPAGTIGTTLSLAAAQDAKGGTYSLGILGTSGSLTAQTTVTVTINEPDFSGTYTGSWKGTFTSSGNDKCVIAEGGTATVTVVKSLPAGYAITVTLQNAVQSWNGATCAVTATTTLRFNENGSYGGGRVQGPTTTIAGRTASGSRSDVYPGGSETVSYQASR